MEVKITAQPVRPSLNVVEQLRADGEMRLARCRPEGGAAPVLVVTPVHDHPQTAIVKRLEHEFALRAELDPAWAVHPLELRYEGGRMLLVLEDPGGRTLDRITGTPFQIGPFLRIAIPLTAAIGQAHARGLIHKDLKPANILVDTASSSVWLTGFGIATRFPQERQVPAPPEQIAGTLAYMAPEQTGRMNRSVDARSDLYALGITFYEMLTGTLPFAAADPMEWVHCHMARQADPPEARVKEIPGMLSSIVMKLLGKTAEARYQTAAGVEADLRRCLDAWESSGWIDPFALGTRDVPDRLMIPETLYGREHEIATLLAAFEHVVAKSAPELVLVSGYSGIGKSSVVNELHKALVSSRGLFASGKFDQYKRDIPYATITQAFHSLVREILGKSEAEVSQWRDALRDALGPNGQLIVNLIPELALIIGQQPPVPDLPSQDAQRHFQLVFWRFLGVFAKAAHPLVLFLDDLQWLDAATLDLLEYLLTQPETRHLLLVGAYRDNEVGPAHPLMRTLEAIRMAGVPVREIVLAPLGLDDLGRLVADALHCAPARARPLAQLVHEKTGGNPFFANQFLTALAEEGLLRFDPAAPAWQWDIGRIRARNYTDNVVDLMTAKLQRLPASTQEAVQAFACLGNVAEMATLILVHGATEAAMHAALADAVQAGLVFRLEGAYRFPHDRIQQAAYALIPEMERADVHLRLGRRLLAGMSADECAERVFDLANQFNRGVARLTELGERAAVAAINLRAGRKAKAAAAYAAACAYLAAGIALFQESNWRRQYALMFDLCLEGAECAFLSGDVNLAARHVGTLLQRAASKIDQAAVYHLKVQLQVVQGEYAQAVESGLTCLRRFGIDLPAHPSRKQVEAEYEAIWRQLGERPIESLIDLPLMSDPELLAATRLLSILVDAAYFTDFHLFGLLLCRTVNISLQHGMSGAAAHAYGWLGYFLGPTFHRYRDGYRFARLACDLAEKHGFLAYQARICFVMGLVASWNQPISSAIDFLRVAFRTANETGAIAFACYCMDQLISALVVRNDPLEAVWRETEKNLDFVREAGFRDITTILVSLERFIATMQGQTATFFTFNDAQFNERVFEAQLTSDRMTSMICQYWIVKLKARFLAGDYAEAFAAADKAKVLLQSIVGHIQLLDYFTYTALTVAALYDDAPADQQAEWRDLLAVHQDQLREWTDNYAPTFGDKHALISAEIARLEGRDADAMRFYEAAIQSAREHGFVQNEGLAHEVAAQFYAARGVETIAQVYWRNARFCYRRWGAEGKVRQLEQSHPWLREDAAPLLPTATVGASVAQLELGAVVRAAQAVSGEIVFERLMETLMTIALEHAGAERGLLVLLRGDTLQIEAEAKTAGATIEVTLRQEPITAAALPESVLHTVIRTQHSVILDDATAQNPFAADAYIRQTHARSVLCLPLIKQAKLIGVLYLENSLASHVFTPARISVLELLASQAAISLENARLYAELQVSEDRWRNLFENVPIGVTLTGPHGRYVAVNQAFQRMTGYSEAELRNLSPVDITHEDERTAAEAILAARAAGRPYPQHHEKRYRRKDGGVIWVDASAFVAPVVAGAPLFAAVVVDITDRKRAEEDLRRSEASLAQAQQISRTGSWRWNVSTGEVSPSAELLHIFGFDPMATQPSYTTFMERIHPDDRPAFEQVLDQAVRDRSRFQHEYRIALPNGSVKYLQIFGQPDSTECSDLEFVGTVMDITERRRAEEALRNAQAELVRVARLTTMGELLASIAHEINQPLAAVASSGGACLRWLNRDQPDLASARDAASRVVRDAHRAGDVIRSLRSLTQKSGPQLTRLDIRDAIKEVLALTRGELQQHGVVLHTDLTAGEQPVLGDRVQLQQVLLNLIMNGIQAMADVTDDRRELTVSVDRAEPDRVQVAVEDTGPGLDPAIAPRIFEPFFTTKSDGLGMGLSICRSIVEAHGGQLWASPRAPHGTAFHFTIPIAVEV
jgi:PAS domain S-box-containing protein